MQRTRRLIMALLVMGLAACSGKPSDSDAVRLFNEDNKRLGKTTMALFDFENVHRINGYEKEGNYVVEMEFDIVPKMGYDEATEYLIGEAGSNLFARQRLSDDINYMKREFGQFKKGDRYTKKRPVLLRRTEAGWALAQ